MKTSILVCAAMLIFLFTSCKKENLNLLTTPPDAFIEFIIPQSQHYALNNSYKPIETMQLKFTVLFDSSAIYATANPENQYDINKLYGFSDNNANHHEYSARIGWRWSDKALRLFAYTYNDGAREEKEITAIAIGEEHQCSIKITEGAYLFSVNQSITYLPRKSNTPIAKGYQLYPYFGGDETAPHEVRIWIRPHP